jgi:hypothetical protein
MCWSSTRLGAAWIVEIKTFLPLHKEKNDAAAFSFFFVSRIFGPSSFSLSDFSQL